MDILNKYERVELRSLGCDLFDKPMTSAEWKCETKCGYTVIINEPIENNIVGKVYYDLLFEAFVQNPSE